MSTVIEATVVAGLLHPDVPLGLVDGSRVKLQLQSVEQESQPRADAFQEFLRYREHHPVNLGGQKFNREELYVPRGR